jgi:polyhydroxyalkanoate synthesis regulator phasin
LDPVTFNWKDKTWDQMKKYGFIAQEVQKVLPDLITTSKDGKLSLDYNGLIAPIVKSIQEQQKEISDQGQQINNLNQQIDDLKQQIEELKEQK